MTGNVHFWEEEVVVVVVVVVVMMSVQLDMERREYA